jgi:hypothetical protein
MRGGSDDPVINSVSIEEILAVAEKIETWNTSDTENRMTSCYGSYLTGEGLARFGVNIKPQLSLLLNKVKAVDLYIEYRGSNSSTSVLGKYYGVDWPAAIKMYESARENAKNNIRIKLENNLKEGVERAKLLAKK